MLNEAENLTENSSKYFAGIDFDSKIISESF